MLFGYFWAFVRAYPKVVSDGFVQYLRSEQISRMQSLFRTGKISLQEHEPVQPRH